MQKKKTSKVIFTYQDSKNGFYVIQVASRDQETLCDRLNYSNWRKINRVCLNLCYFERHFQKNLRNTIHIDYWAKLGGGVRKQPFVESAAYAITKLFQSEFYHLVTKWMTGRLSKTNLVPYLFSRSGNSVLTYNVHSKIEFSDNS